MEHNGPDGTEILLHVVFQEGDSFSLLKGWEHLSSAGGGVIVLPDGANRRVRLAGVMAYYFT